MANTLKFGNGQWATKVGSTLAYNDENDNFKPLPFNFTRSTGGTRVNKDGLIEMVTNNKPRIDFLNDSNGALLLEPTRSNRITNSEDGSTWSLSNITLSSLSGGLNKEYYEITSLGDTSRFGVVSNSWVNLTAENYTASVFAKKGTTDEIILTPRASFSNQDTYSVFNLTNGTVVSNNAVTGSIESYSDGWYKCSITFTNSGGYTNFASFAFGFNFNSSITDTLFVASPQSEIGSYATSYIPTQGATATRVDEVCSQTPPSGIIGQTQGGVIYMDFIAQNSGSNSQSHFWIGSAGNEIGLYGGAQFIFYSSGGVSINGGNVITGQRYKVAFAYETNDYVAYVNGVQVGLDNSATYPNMNNISINSYFNGTEIEKKQIKDFKLYNTRLSNAELQQLTTL